MQFGISNNISLTIERRSVVMGCLINIIFFNQFDKSKMYVKLFKFLN